jgi:hypothetical protein
MRFSPSALPSMGLAAGLVIASVAFAPPSHAGTDCGSVLDDLPSGYSLSVGDSVTMNVSCLLGQLNTNFGGPVAATTSNGGVTVTPNPATATAGVASFTIQGSAAGFTLVTYTADGVSAGQLFTVTGGGGGGGTISSSAASTPVEVSLSLDLAASGASCREGSAATGTMGTWLTLPAADDCSSTTDPDAQLLGWSTSANFPVARAQSQVDNNWGAIDEIFDGVRMIFIPAGKATFVSGPNSLYPIWSD